MSIPTNISNLKKWITDNIILAFVAFLLLTILIVVIATAFSYGIVLVFDSSNQNCTLNNCTSFINQNSSSFVSIFANTMLTLALIGFSALSLSSAQDTLRQSKEQQKLFQDEQRIRDIEKRLEFFYIPADEIIDFKYRTREHTINGYKRNTDGQFVLGLQNFRKYSYLAEKATYDAYEKYMSTNCTKEKPITCQDTYKKLNFNECENFRYNCHNNWSTCPQNLIYCEHHPDHGKPDNNKDKNRCTLNNANCKYINDLKKRIKADIKNYKNELLELKK